MEDSLLLAHDGERENVNEKLSSNIVVVVARGGCKKAERRCSWMVRAKRRYRCYIDIGESVDFWVSRGRGMCK